MLSTNLRYRKWARRAPVLPFPLLQICRVGQKLSRASSFSKESDTSAPQKQRWWWRQKRDWQLSSSTPLFELFVNVMPSLSEWYSCRTFLNCPFARDDLVIPSWTQCQELQAYLPTKSHNQSFLSSGCQILQFQWCLLEISAFFTTAKHSNFGERESQIGIFTRDGKHWDHKVLLSETIKKSRNANARSRSEKWKPAPDILRDLLERWCSTLSEFSH